MVSKEQQRGRAIRRIGAHLLKTGLGEASLRQLAAAAGVSDRMLIYYFDDKKGVLAAALTAISIDLAKILDQSIPVDAALGPAALIERATKVTRGAAMRPYMSLWLEIVVAASRGSAPYVDVARAVTDGFTRWIELRLAGDGDKRAQAIAILAIIDGIAIIDASMSKKHVDHGIAAIATLWT